VSFYISTVANC